jgi:phosphoadenosine phosphosulfate reductase
MLIYKCVYDNIETNSSVCPVCGRRTEIVKSEIYWCDKCNIPVYEENCGNCNEKCRKLTTDIRPVFPEERLLIEIILGEPLKYVKESVWNGTGNHYFVNGKRIDFSIKNLKHVDADEVRESLLKYSADNTYKYFDMYCERFVNANIKRYQAITEEAFDYIRHTVNGAAPQEMFISFSGGKDSTVTADVVMRALSDPHILHIFGDTTLEFPDTYEYVMRYKEKHHETPVVSSRNNDKDFGELCELVGPPSRVMRWCCTIFKTGAIQRKISSLFRNQNRIITFYGIRRSESTSRSKYDRESSSPKITKQITVSPVIDWMDFDIWLYILTTGIDFNDAYRKGYARVGCWCCPNNSAWSEMLSRIYMPEQYKLFHEMLVEFAKKVGKPDPEDYVAEGGWKARQGGNGVSYASNAVVSFTPCALEENSFNYKLVKPVSEQLYELFKPFGAINYDLGNKRLGEVYIIGQSGKPVLRLQGRIGSKELKITILDHHIAGARSLKTAEEKVKCQITKYQMCMACRACESICRYNAITVTDKDGAVDYRINESKCRKCCECVGHYDSGCYMKKVLATKQGK